MLISIKASQLISYQFLVKENNNRVIPGTEVVHQEKEEDGDDHYYDDISAPLDPQFTFDNFIVGKPNELAYAAAQRVAQSEVVSFNPLFLYGGVGLGKTHLMHAVAWNIKKRNPKKECCLSHSRKIYVSIH